MIIDYNKESRSFLFLFLITSILFSVYCCNKFAYNIYSDVSSFSSYSKGRLSLSPCILYSSSSQMVRKLYLYSSLSIPHSFKKLDSHPEAIPTMPQSYNILKRPKLVVDLNFAERLRDCQKNDSIPLVNDIIVKEQKQSWVIYVIINSLNALPIYRGISNMNVDLIYENHKYHNKFKVVKEHQIRLLKYVIKDLPLSGSITLIDHATSWEYLSLPYRVVPTQPKRKIAICAYISSYNSAHEIKFFLAYYLIQKVDTVIFYCAENFDFFFKLLKKEIENGYVILYNYPWPLTNALGKVQRSIQISQINSCYYRHQSFFEYIISIDLDEYLYSEILPYNLYHAIQFSFKLSPPKDDIAV